MIRSVDDALAAGEPLIDIVVIFKEGVDYDLATAAIGALGADIELHSGHWYGNPQSRIGQVTAEGALRLFGARFTRVPFKPQYPEWVPLESQSECFLWSSTQITRWPDEIAPYVKSISAPQPASNDDGQPYVPLFDRSP
jgi:hypothetical protein